MHSIFDAESADAKSPQNLKQISPPPPASLLYVSLLNQQREKGAASSHSIPPRMPVVYTLDGHLSMVDRPSLIDTQHAYHASDITCLSYIFSETSVIIGSVHQEFKLDEVN